MEKIWCLFSVENDYDQPDYNLITWWKDKPSYDLIGKALGMKDFTVLGDSAILTIVKLASGNRQRICNTDYFLEEIKEGQVMEEKNAYK